DEIEKAHPDVFNILLQILDEGRLTDSQGRTVSFKNTIIIMTSNLGADIILRSPYISSEVKSEVMQIVHRTFRPEFLNRIDAIVFFKKLLPEDLLTIAKIQIDYLIARLADRSIALIVEPEVLRKIAREGYDPEFGARPLKRTIQQSLGVPISQLLLKNPEKRTIRAQLIGESIVLI
ncbi:MAG TPA: AAA family ATPase, partial [Candidatus Babeliaceae bacterium]|nr:AAA family ATPase [Candidatus Babeliaceae bacterium]